ncbi:MAG: APC family permease [Acidimicrobiales bacterium]
MTSTSSGTLVRQLGLGGAVVTGLGSILGTGVFVSIAIAAGEAGAWVMLAAPLAALVAIGNGMSSAQLAAAHPVAGGTYEYGYRYLHPWAGHVAGVLFLTAKSASAATAALGFATYLLALIGVDDGWRVPIAVATVVAVTALVIAGVRRTTTVNLVLVALTIGALLVFVVGGTVSLATDDLDPARLDMSGFAAWWRVLPEATALMFVAYTGYGRIATLGEEVRDPRQTIPRAVIATLAVSALLYTSVAVVGWRLGGIEWRVDGADGERINAPLAALLDGPVARSSSSVLLQPWSAYCSTWCSASPGSGSRWAAAEIFRIARWPRSTTNKIRRWRSWSPAWWSAPSRSRRPSIGLELLGVHGLALLRRHQRGRPAATGGGPMGAALAVVVRPGELRVPRLLGRRACAGDGCCPRDGDCARTDRHAAVRARPSDQR